MGYHTASDTTHVGCAGAEPRTELASRRRRVACQLIGLIDFIEEGEGDHGARIRILGSGGDQQLMLEPTDRRHDARVGPFDLAWRVGCNCYGKECEGPEGVGCKMDGVYTS